MLSLSFRLLDFLPHQSPLGDVFEKKKEKKRNEIENIVRITK